MESNRDRNLKSGNSKGKMLRWCFRMEEERQLEQTDRKRMRSISVSIPCDIRFTRSIGSADQSDIAGAMDDAAAFAFCFFSLVKVFFSSFTKGPTGKRKN